MPHIRALSSKPYRCLTLRVESALRGEGTLRGGRIGGAVQQLGGQAERGGSGFREPSPPYISAGGLPPIGLVSRVLSLCAALLAACRRVLLVVLQSLAASADAFPLVSAGAGPLFSLRGWTAVQELSFIPPSVRRDRSAGGFFLPHWAGGLLSTLRGAPRGAALALRGGAGRAVRDTIQIPVGGFELEIPTTNDDIAAAGDYDITAPVIHRRRRPEHEQIRSGG
jgi:hypothetical protein